MKVRRIAIIVAGMVLLALTTGARITCWFHPESDCEFFCFD